MWFKSANGNGVSTAGAAAANRRDVPSILSAGLKVEGDVVSDGEVHIIGSLSGNLTARKLTLGEGGTLNGMVETEMAVINGRLTGRLAAVNVVLGRTAHVTADIIYVSMRIEPGAVFEGYSRRVESIETISSETVQLPPPRPTTAAAATPAPATVSEA